MVVYKKIFIYKRNSSSDFSETTSLSLHIILKEILGL